MQLTRIVMTCSSICLGLVGSASADQGAIEINQTTAITGGPGDPAGFPVVISQAGLYRLSGNLDLAAAGASAATHAIQVMADDVTIDLQGFRIVGSTDCSALPAGECSGTGTGNGIDAPGRRGLVVRNGTIRGMGQHGIWLDDGRGARVEGVRAISNGGFGIAGSESSSGSVVGCLVLQNGLSGIVNGRGHIRENVVARNGDTGIASLGIVSRNVVSENFSLGLFQSAAYSENFFNANNSAGLQVGTSAPQPAPNACAFNTSCP